MLDRLSEKHAQDLEVKAQHKQQLQRVGTMPTPDGLPWLSAMLLILLLSCALATVYGCITEVVIISHSRAAKHELLEGGEPHTITCETAFDPSHLFPMSKEATHA